MGLKQIIIFESKLAQPLILWKHNTYGFPNVSFVRK